MNGLASYGYGARSMGARPDLGQIPIDSGMNPVLQGYAYGQQQDARAQALQTQQFELDQAQQQADNQQQLNQLASQAYTTAPDQRNTLLANMAKLDPREAQAQSQMFAQMDATKREQVQQAMQQAAGMATAVSQMPDGPQKQQAWNGILQRMQQSGKDTSLYSQVGPDVGAKMMLAQIADSKQLLDMAGAQQKKYTLAEVPYGTGKAAVVFDPSTGTSKPLAGASAGAQSAPSGLPAETLAYVPKVMAALGGAQPFDASGQPTPQLMDAVMHVESGGNPNALSPKGAQGAYQLMPATAASVGVTNPNDPAQARAGAQKYLAQLYQQFGGDANKAIAAYNAGPGRVSQAMGGQQPVLGIGTGKEGSNAGTIPSGFQWNQDHTRLVPMPGGPEDPESNPFDLTPDAVNNAAWNMIMDGKMPQLGRSKEALHVRATIMNKVADIAKQAGISSADLATQGGRTKALQASLQNLQKQSDVMEKSENTFLNNANVLLDLSDKVSRSGVPAFNQFLLHVKTNYKGDPDAAAFLTARNLVAQEYAKIASSATGAAGSSDTSQGHALELINTAQTPEQLRSVIATLEKDINGQKQSTEQQLLNISARMQQLGAANQYPGHAFNATSASAGHGASPMIATNPQTGQRVQWNGSAWVPLQ